MPPTTRPLAFAFFAFLVGPALLALPAAPAHAQDDDVDWGYEGGDGDGDAPVEVEGDVIVARDGPIDPFLDLQQPARVLGRAGVGIGVRLGVDDDLAQETLAPLFFEAMAGYVFAGKGREALVSPLWRHGLTFGLATNLLSDGPEVAEVEIFRQYTFNLSYLAYLRFGMDFVLTARIGPSFTVGGTTNRESRPGVVIESTDFEWTWGGEVAVGGQYMILAGFGLYVDLEVGVFAGAGETTHPIASLSAGAVIDWELIQ